MVQTVERQLHLDGHHAARYVYSRDLVFGKTVDMGCGHGAGTHILSMGQKVTELLGIDVTETVIADATTRWPDINFKCAHLHEVKETFDSLVCLGVIEHVEDFKKTKECLKAMLNPGGIFIYYVPYLEEEGTNIHHRISMLYAESFLDEFPNSEFLYQGFTGGLIEKANSITFGILGVYRHPM